MTEGAVLENGWTYLEIAPHLMLSATNVLSPWDLPRQASATASELRVSHACTSTLSSSEAVSCDGKVIDLLPELLTRLGMCFVISHTFRHYPWFSYEGPSRRLLFWETEDVVFDRAECVEKWLVERGPKLPKY